MVWARGRELPEGRFRDLLELAPVLALVLDGDRRVLAANRAAREFFGIDPDRLPAGLLDATREGRLLEALHAGSTEAELRLTHRQRTVQVRVVPGAEAGRTLMFVVDVSELRRLETVRQEFVANLSHELKTPLTSLRLAAESLLGTPPPPAAARRRFAQRVLTEADHLANVIANLRLLAQIEAGHVALTLARFDVRELVTETAERLRLDRPLELRIPERLEISADRTKLAQVLDNLLDNAAKFSPPSSPIEVEAGVDEREFRLLVRDYGPGISPEHWPRVFERFYKVDPARSRGTAGSGLGLSITKHLVLAQGGRVWTEAARDGGQRFCLAIPLPVNGAINSA